MNRMISSVLRGVRRCGLAVVLGHLPATAEETPPTPAGAGPIVVRLWNGPQVDAPGGDAGESVGADGSVAGVSRPEISVYRRTDRTTPAPALIVCPGGSYIRVGRYTTGMGLVDHFRPRGFVVVVVKYRTRPPAADVFADALADAQRAVRLVRHHARAWGVDPQRVGMVGSSAGAHLILNAATHADRGNPGAADPVERESCAPDFVGLLCPWPAGQGIEAFPVRAGLGPAFVCSALDDPVAPTSFARAVVAAYQRAGVAARLWTVERGGHRAFTLGGRGPGARWVDHFEAWLQEQGVIR
jgi:acetyl esterase/lipase